MYAIIRKFNRMREIDEVGRRVERGLGPIMRQASGFRGYYVIKASDTVGVSVSLFDNQETAERAHERALSWIRDNIGEFITGGPEITAGPVLVDVESHAMA